MQKREGDILKYTKELCLSLLKDKAAQLNTLPKKSDFSEAEIVAVKSFLGPWPRALEAAGLKEPRNAAYTEKKLQKRICAKRKITQMKIQKKKGQNDEN